MGRISTTTKKKGGVMKSINQQIIGIEKTLRKLQNNHPKPSALWTVYHTVLAAELAIVIVLLTLLLMKGVN